MIELLAEVLLRAVCFPVGWLTLRLVTFGKYPPEGTWHSGSPTSEWVTAIGLAVLVVAMMASLRQFVFS